MAVNYASKYSTQVQEKFAKESITDRAVNTSIDFAGVNAVNIYSIPTVGMNDYKMTGTSRYGDPKELENTVQTLTMSKDRSFTFTIDRRNYTDTQMTMEAGKALVRQLKEVVIPEIDVYRLGKIVAGAESGNVKEGNITKTNAYQSFLDGVTALMEANVPMEGAFAYISANFYKAIRQDENFIKRGDMSQEMLAKGVVGEIDGVPVVYAPGSRLPENVEFLITKPEATVVAQKLAEYKTHDNPPGINGWLVEGRLYYDAWVLDSKKPCIYVHKKAASAK